MKFKMGELILFRTQDCQLREEFEDGGVLWIRMWLGEGREGRE